MPSGRGTGSRNAAHPVNAIMNYAYAALQSQVQIKAVAEGYDPMLGVMHHDRDGAPGPCQGNSGGVRAGAMLVAMTNPFRCFNSSPDFIRLVVMMCVRYPLSLRNVEDLLAERGVDISHETVRFWWNRFGPMFAAEIRKKRVVHLRGCLQWRWHLDEVFVKVNGKLCYLRRAVDHEGEVLEVVVTAKRDKTAALKLLKRVMKKYGGPAASSPMGFERIPRR